MSSRNAVLVSSALALLLVSVSWLALKPRPVAQTPQAARPAAPPNPAHERSALEEQLKRKPGHAPVLLRLAELDLELNQPALARKRLEEILKVEPGNTDALLELGRLCFSTGDVECAVTRTSSILAREPGHPDALYNLGAIYANQGRFEQARQYWNRAVQADPKSESGRKAAAGLKQI